MRVPNWHVCNRYGNTGWPRSAKTIFRDSDVSIRERRTADCAEVVKLHYQTLAHPVEICDLFKGAPLPFLCALSVAGVQQGETRRPVALVRNRRAHAGVHSAA